MKSTPALLRPLMVCLLAMVFAVMPAKAAEHAADNADGEEDGVPVKEIIFEHLGDGYGWEVPFNHHVRIPLPVIVKGSKGWHVFSSSQVTHGDTYTHPDGSRFRIAGEESEHKGKVVEVMPDESEVRPLDFSITKNVAAIIITALLVIWMVLGLAAFHRNNRSGKAPRGFLGAVESLVLFIYDGVIKPILGDKSRRFAPYLLTVFMFIFIANLLGLCVIFPGGANLTGNIAITLVLAIITFLYTNLFATKHYWKEIFWPEVPLFLKFPLPIMQVIELFGVFTKPAALTVRLFANMMGGHMIVLVLTMLIFIFAAVAGQAVASGAAVVSMLFSVFMLLIDVLVSFIQAYVFTMLSTIFIGLAQESGHGEGHDAHKADASHPVTENK
ncbi:MAG: F0F1 ATP synthase subunit A [Bacteroidales bacterium]|nr:F0F1 ATP synthase subunit A [Bacteroidales bacterium]